MKNILIRMQQA